MFFVTRDGISASAPAPKVESAVRSTLVALSVAVPAREGEQLEERLPAAFHFPRRFEHAAALFSAMRKAQWRLHNLSEDAFPAYTEMFVATPAAVKYWVGCVPMQPRWNDFRLADENSSERSRPGPLFPALEPPASISKAP